MPLSLLGALNLLKTQLSSDEHRGSRRDSQVSNVNLIQIRREVILSTRHNVRLPLSLRELFIEVVKGLSSGLSLLRGRKDWMGAWEIGIRRRYDI